jgi:hypothetical protein
MDNFDINKINQVIDGKFIGYHEKLSKFGIKKGDFITIKKGTKYHSMKDGEYHIAGKTYKVKVNHLIHGTQYEDYGKKIVRNTEVRWAGSGGYWYSVDINDVFTT